MRPSAEEPPAGEAPIPLRLGMTLQETGSGVLVLESGDLRLGAGDLALYLGEPITQPQGAAGQSPWNIPLPERAAAQWKPLATLPVILSAQQPATALLAHIGRHLAAAAETLPPALGNQFFEHLLGMIEETLAHGKPRESELSKLARFHLRRMELYLQFHLRDPKFSVRNMAADLGLSVSHVNRLFVHEGCSVAEWIRSERLDGCAADLASLAQVQRSVGTIAHSWGFNNLSHFSIAFRKRFGMSPRDWRQPPLGAPGSFARADEAEPGN